ncbi:MAG: helix-turn-helix domain-containing protein [Lachnospiraceae bacterium]|jgi:predicted transcriptional regulator|nr:helix-turn-helix domain-containing protein [Lachnospiraceae bacterium]MCX4272376.1 winged helix-turn-helix transcriptional regulator [Acetatifactor sp.]
MLYFQSIGEAEAVFKALSTPMRLKIMEMIYKDDKLSMNDLAEALGLTNGAISMHVSKLEEAGLVKIRTTSGKRGTMKIIRPRYDRLMIDLAPIKDVRHCYTDDIQVGYYTTCSVVPTCGLATNKEIIGSLDDARVFSFPERFKAGILWFGSGYVEYNLPNHLQAGQTLTELQISFEISSECPEYNEDYPSDIHFSINGVALGMWVSPGDFGARKGYLCPGWWPELLNQYGLLKTLIINNEGCFIDGNNKISDVTIQDLNLNYNSYISFRFEVPKDTANVGGCTLFGEDFGDYNQAIKVKAYYEEESEG